MAPRRHQPSPGERRRRARAAGQAARGGARRAARPVAAVGAAGLWEPLLELADRRLKSPRHESRWFNLAGFFLRPGRGFPLDEVQDQGALADLPPRGQAHQGRAVLGRVVDPLAPGGRGPVAPASRRDLSPARPVSAAGQGHKPGQEGRPPQARAARARRDVAAARPASSDLRRTSRNRWAMPS